MNHIYRNVWNEITRTYVAAAEIVKGRGKKSKSSAGARPGRAQPRESRFISLIIFTIYKTQTRCTLHSQCTSQSAISNIVLLLNARTHRHKTVGCAWL